MNTTQKTAIIIPCYNESQRIRKDDFLNSCDLYKNISFVFVNDCSEDNTGQILEELKKNNPKQIVSITLLKNSGKAEAVRKGILHALKGNFDFIGFWDADLSTPLSNIKQFKGIMEEKPETDIVMGARVKLLGRSISRQAPRHYLGRIFATFSSMVLNLPVYDTQCGAKLFRNSALMVQIFEEPFKSRWIFDVEIIARYLVLSNNSLEKIIFEKIYEYPLESWTHVTGSKTRLKDFILSGMDLFSIWIYYRKNFSRNRPIDNSHK